jgi:hypothetical protein
MSLPGEAGNVVKSRKSMDIQGATSVTQGSQPVPHIGQAIGQEDRQRTSAFVADALENVAGA